MCVHVCVRDDARFLMPFRGLVGVLLWEVMKKRRERGRCLPHCNLPPCQASEGPSGGVRKKRTAEPSTA